jgi:hypothetical protein
MEKLAFHSKFLQWIMTYVTTVRYSGRFIGTPLSPFRPSRGLRQGDLLSLYLFLLVTDCLSLLVKNYERQGPISGIRVSRRGPTISHLLFADDSILFFKLNVQQELVSVFERSTGQQLSPCPSKCSLLFHEDAVSARVLEVKQVLGIERAGFDEKYLGLPLPTGKLKGNSFQSIEERYVKRMTDWRDRCLSQVAKEVLIKSVGQALPTYVMSVFTISFGLCDTLQKHTRSFWWGAEGGKPKTQWIPWDVLIKPKSYGGLGFKDAAFNQATGNAAIGIIARDHEGQPRIMAWRVLHHCRNAEEAEAIALLEGTRLAEFWPGNIHVDFESDCGELIKKVQCKNRDYSMIAAVISDIKQGLGNRVSYSIRKIWREQNKIAHNLAQFASKPRTSQVSFSAVPLCIQDLVLHDRYRSRYSVGIT